MTETAYLCPICRAELVRFPADWRVITADLPIGSISHQLYIAEAVKNAATRHAQSVDATLADAVAAHRCAKPRRWRRWKRAHREELAAAAAR